MNRTLKICFGLALLAIICISAAPHPVSSVVVIVNAGNPVNALTTGECKLYYLRKVKRRWPTINKNIKPVAYKGKPEYQEHFYKNVLQMTHEDVEQYFTMHQYQNAERPQDKFESEREVIQFVSSEMGAIGYVRRSSLTAEDLSNVRIVNEIGK